MTYKKLLIKENSKIKKAYELMNLSGEKCLFVIDNLKNFKGTISDGDIRKSILKNFNLNSSIKAIYNKNSFFIDNNNYDENAIIYFFKKFRYNAVPILKNNKVIDFINYQKILEKKINLKNSRPNLSSIPLVIMAGGKGSRLKPFSNVIPKPLFPIDDKSFIEKIINSFLPFKVNDIVISVNYKASLIKSFFQELKPKYNFSFLDENKEMGTVGSLSLLKKKIKSDFFLTNCDIIVDIDYQELFNFHKKEKNDLTIVVASHDYQIPYGSCILDKKGKLSKIVEKPKFDYILNCGLYIFNKKILSLIPKNKKLDFNELIEIMLNKNCDIGVYPININSWKDIGELKNYKELINNL